MIRYDLRDVLAGVSALPRVARCGAWRIPGGAPAVRLAGGVAHFAGVQLCGSVWSCPVCAPRIRQTRAVEVDDACARWLARGGAVLLVTFTLPHDLGEPLAATLRTVRRAFTSLTAGRARVEDRATYGLEHFIRAHDCTHGGAGWHPHLHVLLFMRSPLAAPQLDALGARLLARWAHAVERDGRRRPTSEGFSIEQARNREDASRYVCQVVGDDARGWGVAMELARGDLKRSRHAGQRTPWEILASFAETGDTAALGLWREWELTTKGVHAIQWSRGLRGLLQLGAERTDEELVAEEIGGEVVYVFNDGEDWRAVRETRGARAQVLELAERGGLAGAWAAIAAAVGELRSAWELRRRREPA
jgi:hypothetical protein